VDFQYIITIIEKAFQLAGVVILILGALVALLRAGTSLILRRQGVPQAFRKLRAGLGRAILVGLELLVAADIIRSVAIDPTFQSVGVLALIVLVRTFLSWSLEVEITGAWPWQRSRSLPDTTSSRPE
jgi:uncharacterized membrane protein